MVVTATTESRRHNKIEQRARDCTAVKLCRIVVVVYVVYVVYAQTLI